MQGAAETARAAQAASPSRWVLWGEHNQPSSLGCEHHKSPKPLQAFFHASVPALSSGMRFFKEKESKFGPVV